MNSGRRVVVTGLGVATPIGIGIEPFWDALIERRCGIRRIEAFDPAGFPVRIAAELPPFQLGDYIPKSYRKSAKVMSRDITIAVVCAYLAVRDAGLNTKCIIDRDEAVGEPNVDSTRFGANIGAGLVCADLSELAAALNTAADSPESFSLARWGTEGMSNLTPLWLLKFLPNMLACHVTIVHDAQAPSNTITCAEASSHLALGEAYRTIARGDADVCICGGAESKANPMALTRPLLTGRLTTDGNDTPQSACRPFADDRAGTVVGEGGGLLILESLEHARRRNARIYAEITGFAAASSCHHWSEPDPTGRPVAIALRNALSDAGISADAVQLVGPVGVGTRHHDAAELAGWRGVFQDRLGAIPALTTRGSIGNCGAGAGAMDLAATVMAVNRSTVPPSLNAQQGGTAGGFRFTATDPIDARITNAVSLGFALTGGQHAALVVTRYQE